MAPPKKPAGRTPARQFRLGDAAMADIDLIKLHHGLGGWAEAIRYAARKEAARIRKTAEK